jgi:hypothetical protein
VQSEYRQILISASSCGTRGSPLHRWSRRARGASVVRLGRRARGSSWAFGGATHGAGPPSRLEGASGVASRSLTREPLRYLRGQAKGLPSGASEIIIELMFDSR